MLRAHEGGGAHPRGNRININQKRDSLDDVTCLRIQQKKGYEMRVRAEARMQLFRYLLSVRKVWLPPLIISCVILVVIVVLVGGNVDIPFLYGSAR